LKKQRLFLVLLAIWAIYPLNSSYAQQSGNGPRYKISPAPDAWYNDVDGLRLGLRLRGRQPGTVEEGPHRLDMGIWLGTWLPDYPVSYYLSFIEPIESLTGFNSEASLQLISSFRTGWQDHGIGFNKRWQPGFDEMHYTELSFFLRAQHRFDMEYVPLPVLWQKKWLSLMDLHLRHQNDNGLGRFVIENRVTVNVPLDHDAFIRYAGSYLQNIRFGKGLGLKSRLFAGISSNNTAREYLFSTAVATPVNWMDSGFTRAKGTIPKPWMDAGNIQLSGGPNLRGYTSQDIKGALNGTPYLYTSILSANFEMDYPNPMGHALKSIPIAGDFIELRSYLFFDAGTSPGITSLEESRTLADAGAGFMLSVNIPDYLGKSRGFKIRYDIPLWLSHPGSENNFKYRNLIGIGAVIDL